MRVTSAAQDGNRRWHEAQCRWSYPLPLTVTVREARVTSVCEGIERRRYFTDA
jgi:hypothetical protein